MMSKRNLADEIYNLLLSNSQPHAERWNALFIDNYPTWLTALPEEDVQCMEINAFWRHQLGLVKGNTINVRASLIDGVCSDYCIGNFKKYVLPSVLALPLPCLK